MSSETDKQSEDLFSQKLEDLMKPVTQADLDSMMHGQMPTPDFGTFGNPYKLPMIPDPYLTHPDYDRLPNGTLRRREQMPPDYTQPYWGHENGRSTIEEQVYNVGQHVVEGRTKSQAALQHAVGSTLLEVACSPGVVLKEARERGFVATGIEPCPDHVEFIQNYSGCEVLCGLFGELDLSDRRFDTIVALDVLEHVPDPGHFVQEALKLLNPGGRLVVMIPAIIPGTEFREVDFHPEHLHLFHENHLREWLNPIVLDIWHPGHIIAVAEKH